MKEVTIYTDGSAKGNPGKGGYGTVLISGQNLKQLSQGYLLTTNNRMELLAVIIGLEALNQKCKVNVYSDSKYVVDSVEKGWVFNWQKKGFTSKKNTDLWKRFLMVYSKHSVKLHWVKGHAGNKYNEICDQLAVRAAEGNKLKDDTGYDSN
ncbi:MAG: ribonuclease HI [Flavobacteriales bacterium]|nr:ribonuclease HI [Flavobacteriales bacterium]|tara:strand:+ start:334 stop:786 length:453 start_codon:yes stop_codon:yes gene_type:complete